MNYKIFIFFIIVIFTSCTLKNLNRINFLDKIFDFENFKTIGNIESETSEEKIVLFKDKYGRVIQEYNNYYGFWHQIKRGDSLYKISRIYGVSIDLLAKVNMIRKNTVINWLDYLFVPVGEDYISECERTEVELKGDRFIWPVWGRITSGFGLRRRRFHKGLDIAAPLGTKVMAADDGIVKFSGRMKKYGYVIIISHSDNFETRYAHLSRTLVNVGDNVKKGEIIGFIGKTGRATGYHLHFEIRISEVSFDPLKFLPESPTKLAEIYLEERLRGLRP